MSRIQNRLRLHIEHGHTEPVRTHQKGNDTMAKYLLLKHYRGAPEAVNAVPMSQWTQEEFSAHIKYMSDFADRLKETGEYVSGEALSPEGTCGKPIHEWLELRPFLSEPPTIME
jgi:hypothetical protein